MSKILYCPTGTQVLNSLQPGLLFASASPCSARSTASAVYWHHQFSLLINDGSIFAGFRIVRLLGSGGMGEVYLAQHPRLPRRNALKVLPTDVSADAKYRARFNREADLASKLWHPHIVSVHDRGEYNGQLWSQQPTATPPPQTTDAQKPANVGNTVMDNAVPHDEKPPPNPRGYSPTHPSTRYR